MTMKLFAKKGAFKPAPEGLKALAHAKGIAEEEALGSPATPGPMMASAIPVMSGLSTQSLSEALISQLSLQPWWSHAWEPEVQWLVAQHVKLLGGTSLSAAQSQQIFESVWKMLVKGAQKLQAEPMASLTTSPAKTTSGSYSVTITSQPVPVKGWDHLAAEPPTVAGIDKSPKNTLDKYQGDVLYLTPSAAPAPSASSAGDSDGTFSGSMPPLSTCTLPTIVWAETYFHNPPPTNPPVPKDEPCKRWKQLNGQLLNRSQVLHKVFDTLEECKLTGWVAGGAAANWEKAADVDVFVSGSAEDALKVAEALDGNAQFCSEHYSATTTKVADLDPNWSPKPLQVIATEHTNLLTLLDGFDLSVHMYGMVRGEGRVLERVACSKATGQQELKVWRTTSMERVHKIQERYGISAEQTELMVPQNWASEEAWA